MEYAQSLRMLKTGWTPEQRKEYFTLVPQGGELTRAATASSGFLEHHEDRRRGDADRRRRRTALQADPRREAGRASRPIVGKPRPFVKE